MTILQKIQNLTWWTLDIKIKEILTDLFGRVEILEESGGAQSLQNVLDIGNITTLPFYSETDFGGGNNYKTGVLPITGFPFPVNGTSVENTGQITTIGIASSENGGFFVKKEGTVDSVLGFDMPDKSNPAYPAPNIYTLATLDDLPQVVNDFANDAAAAIGGIAVGGLYHTVGVVKIRLS